MNLKSQTIEDLNAGIKNTDNITNFGLGYDLKMFSPLKQINSKNVKKLVPIWSTSLSNEVGEHSQLGMLSHFIAQTGAPNWN